MKDPIERQEAIDAVSDCGICIQRIVELPSAQSEIIHCRECKWHRFDKDNIPYCYNIDYGYGWKDDDFCSRAERREDSNESKERS